MLNQENVKPISLSDIAKHPHGSLSPEDYIWQSKRIRDVITKAKPAELERLKYALRAGLVSKKQVVRAIVYLVNIQLASVRAYARRLTTTVREIL